MFVKEIEPNKKIEEIVLTIEDMEDTRTYLTKWGDEGKVRNATAKDENGDSVKVSFWNDETDLVDVGQTIKIVNGYAKMWNGELQVSAGRYGKLEVM